MIPFLALYYVLVGLAWWAWCCSVFWLHPKDCTPEDAEFSLRVMPYLVLFWPLDVTHVLVNAARKDDE